MENLPDVISICVCEEVRILEVCGTCLFSLIDGIEYGYIYTEPEDLDDGLRRAYGVVFEEALRRLEARGVHLRL
jgi:hypothetical protein